MDKETRRLKVKELATQNLSINAMAKTLGCSWDTVNNDLKFLGITLEKKINQYASGNGVSSDLFRVVNDEQTAYWLGFLYADGSIRETRNEISLALKEGDYETVKAFHEWCGNQNKIAKHVNRIKDKEYYRYDSCFSNAQVKENLINLGCTPKKSLTLIFPTEQQVPQQWQYDFIRGYIDGDGYVEFNPTKRRYRIIVVGTEPFLNGIVQAFGITEGYHIGKEIDENCWTLTIQRKELVYTLLDKLYGKATVYLPRKKVVYDIARAVTNVTETH